MKRVLVTLLLILLPVVVAAQAATRPVNVVWNQTTVANATGYNLYVGSTTGGPYTKINSSVIPVNTPQLADTGTVGTTRFYVVTVVTPACTPTTPVTQPCGESGYSAEAATTVPPRPTVTTTVVLSVP